MPAKRLDQVRQFVTQNLEQHPRDIGRLVEREFDITRQAANKYLRRFIDEGLVTAQGTTKARTYGLAVRSRLVQTYPISPELQEDRIWRERVAPELRALPGNVVEICAYGFTEIFNNAIDHSQGSQATIEVTQTAA